MKEIGRIHIKLRNYFDSVVRICKWTKDEPFPDIGKSVGVDTETELITETNSAPPLVVLGVFDPASCVCYQIDWEHAAAFMHQLCRLDVQQRYFNLGFDEHVLDNEDEQESLIEAIEYGRVRDMQIRTQLNDIATIGFIPGNHWSLAQVTKDLLYLDLDKGEKDDPDSHRLTFRRGREITQKQAEYLVWDCATTWGIGEAVKEQPTEVTHTKGMVVLAHISHNGLYVDPIVFDALEEKLIAQKDEYREKLLDFGFPDPYKNKIDENAYYRNFLEEQLKAFILETSEKEVPLSLNKPMLRWMLLYMYNFSDNPDENEDFNEVVVYATTLIKPTLKKKERELYEQLVNDYNISLFLEAGKEIVMAAFMGHIFEHLRGQLARHTVEEQGYNLKEAIEYAGDIIDEHPSWLTSEKPLGPKVYLQRHIQKLLEDNPKLKLAKTEKSGEYKLTLKDMWRLDDLDIKDPFIEVYARFKHAEKLLSTYLNRSFIKSDGKVHTNYTNLVRTGRTASSRPNVLNGCTLIDNKNPLKYRSAS